MSCRQTLSAVLDGMAKGLFASLIVGVILRQVGIYADVGLFIRAGQTAQFLMGPCIGAGVALALGARPFTLLAAMAAGALGAGTVSFGGEGLVPLIKVGEPVGALMASWAAVATGKRLEGHTKFDLLIVPGLMILVGVVVGETVSPVLSAFLYQVGGWLNELTRLQPLPMGILLGVSVGMLLTLPISSAALCIAIGINGLAAGGALAGCCAQMVGFAAISMRDNTLGGVLAQGLGTSMLQIPNIIKNPWIWVPPTVASAVCGPLATVVFKMETNAVGAGMGTSGLVGQFTTFSVMGPGALVSMLLLHFLLPAGISLAVARFMRRRGLIHNGDLAL